MMIVLAPIMLQQAALAEPAELFPLDPGMTWTYEKKSSIQSTPTEYTITVVGETEHDGQLAWEVTVTDAKQSSQTLYRSSEKGIYIVATGPARESVMPPMPLLLSPLEPGKKWKWSGSLPIQDGITPGRSEAKVVGMEQRMVLGKDTECLRVECEVRVGKGKSEVKILRKSWYARGIGLVGEDTTYFVSSESLTERVTLTKYERPTKTR
jgi:hypothetical protein